MIAVIPVVLFVPSALVHLPPAMALAPAVLACLPQFAPFVIGLSAVTSMMFDGFMQLMVGMLDAALASLVNVLS